MAGSDRPDVLEVRGEIFMPVASFASSSLKVGRSLVAIVFRANSTEICGA